MCEVCVRYYTYFLREPPRIYGFYQVMRCDVMFLYGIFVLVVWGGDVGGVE